MAPTAADDPAAAKKLMRKQAMERRAAAAAAAGDAGARLRDHLLACVRFPQGAVVSAYWPMGDEIDPLPALRELQGRGHAVALPVMPGKARPLKFRQWWPEMVLADGGFGTSIPPADARELRPRVLLVPLLAFDRAGYRLGYGGGFYDRTLQDLRGRDPEVLAVGIAYAAQEVAAVPRDAYDQPLDMIVTEQGAVELDSAAGAAG